MKIFVALLFFVGALNTGNAIAGANQTQRTVVDFPASRDTSGFLARVTKGGMPYKLWPSESGKKIEVGKYVKVHLSQLVNDSLLFTTSNSIPTYLRVEDPGTAYDITEVLPTLKEGDSILATQLLDSFLNKYPMMSAGSGFKSGDVLTTRLTVIKVFDREEDYVKDKENEVELRNLQEAELLQDYLKRNNINAVKTAGGTYVEILAPGTGKRVDSGKYVRLLYTGSSIAGEAFDSNTDPYFGHTEPIGFTAGNKEMIIGFDEGVRMLRAGAKARIYIPSSQGYGKSGLPPAIMPFESIVYLVEILEVNDKAPSGNQAEDN